MNYSRKCEAVMFVCFSAPHQKWVPEQMCKNCSMPRTTLTARGVRQTSSSVPEELYGQGNTNEKVHIYRYVTKGTFDTYMWQTVEQKQKFISQIFTSKSPVRVADDIDPTALSFAEIKALSTGNPHIKEKMELDMEVSKLKLIKSSFMSQIYDLEDKVVKFYPKQIAEIAARIKGLEKDIETVKQYPKAEDKFNTMTIDGFGYFEKEKRVTLLLNAARK